VITQAHADHARAGHGHVLGSAQLRLEGTGRVWVASGDCFLSAHDERNATCEPFAAYRAAGVVLPETRVLGDLPDKRALAEALRGALVVAPPAVQAITRRAPAQPGALQLVTFAKAFSGLSDAEFKAIDAVIRANTLEKFGPVCSLRPTLVFELGFEGIAHSPCHKSGIALRFPRMLRMRHDKPLHEADSLPVLQGLLSLIRGGGE
jgi:hypothetical protein